MTETETKVVGNPIVTVVLPAYEKELTEQEERTTRNILKLLNGNKVSDEMVRGRVLAKSKAFTRDYFNASVEQGN